MKCFYHQTIDAVASCKSCCRGLCNECAAEVGLAASCRGRCENDVATLIELAAHGRNARDRMSSTYFRNGIFATVIGVLFALVGIFQLTGDNPSELSYLFVFSGIGFFAMGIWNLKSARNSNQK